MALNITKAYRQETETADFKADTDTPIINRRKRSSLKQMKQDVITLKIENQNLRQELLKLQWQMQQQNMKVLAALGISTEDSGVPEGFI
jgi:hypothetical protein